MDQKIRDKEWTAECLTPGEECDNFHICVDRFDQYDVSGSFSSGKHCYSESEATIECFKKIQYQVTFEEEDLQTRNSGDFGFRQIFYCPNYDPSPRAYWETQETETWKTYENCETDTDCDQGYFCLKQMSRKAFDIEDSGFGCDKKAVCQGSATWQIYKTGEYVQYFCTDAQRREAEDLGKPYDIWTLQQEKKHDRWVEVCTNDDDCGSNQLCRDYFYEADDSLKAWNKGKHCIPNWYDRNCYWQGTGDTYMTNWNYLTTKYDYRYVYICELQDYVEEPEKPEPEDPEPDPQPDPQPDPEPEDPDDDFVSFSNSTIEWKTCK